MKARMKGEPKASEHRQAPDEIMTVFGVAKYLKCHPGTVRRLLKARSLKAFRLGGEWRFFRTDLDAWIEGRKVAPPGES